MIKIIESKKRITTLRDNPVLFDYYIDSIYNTIIKLEQEYPGFHVWFYDKVRSDIMSNKREIIISLVDDHIAGVAILKKTVEEKKICTLRVLERYQKMGLGKRLVLESFEYLDTKTPLITVTSCRENQFKKLFNYFGFEKASECLDYYRKEYKELTYNGILVK